MKWLRHPFWQAILVLCLAWLLFEFGIGYIPPLFGARSAPAPGSVVLQFFVTVLVGILLYVSADERRWQLFQEPIRTTLVDPNRRVLRTILLVTVPLLVGFAAFDRVRPRVQAPPSLRSIHPAPPTQITFRGKTMNLAATVNPLRGQGDQATHYAEGKRIYYQNCLPCHGDFLDGKGHWAHGFNPPPLSFQDNGTIAQLAESFVFWRVAKGGVGLPNEGAPWNSAMPAWEDILTEDEIWAVVLFLYEQTGWQPRAWEEPGAEGGEH